MSLRAPVFYTAQRRSTLFWCMMILPPHNGFLLTAGRNENLFLYVVILFPVLIKKNQCYNHGD